MSRKGNGVVVVSEKKKQKKTMKVIVEHERKVPSGDHLVRAPVALTKVSHTRGARIAKVGENSIRIRHREYLRDIVSTSFEWSSTIITINPGSANCFPWLAGVAWQYEMYELKECRFFYEPVAPTLTAGTVMLAVDYDSADAAITNKLTLMSLQNATRCAPWARCELKHDKTRLRDGPLFVRGANSPYTTDSRLYDYGILYIADSDCMGNAPGTPAAPLPLGELYVEYDVILSIPQRGGTISDNLLESVTNRIVEGGGGMTVAKPFGNVPSNFALPFGANSNIRPYMTYDSPTGYNRIYFPQVGEFFLYLATTGVNLGNWTRDILNGSNIVTTVFDSIQNAGLTTSIYLIAVSVTALSTGFNVLRPYLGGTSIANSVARISACSASYFSTQLYSNIKSGKNQAYHTVDGFMVDGVLLRPQISRYLYEFVKVDLRSPSFRIDNLETKNGELDSNSGTVTTCSTSVASSSSSSSCSDISSLSSRSDVIVDLLTTRSNPSGPERKSFFGSLGF